MLVINPESSCDICLEQFILDGQSRAPHAPRCGHVFCLRQAGFDPLVPPDELIPPSSRSRIDFDLNVDVSSL